MAHKTYATPVVVASANAWTFQMSVMTRLPKPGFRMNPPLHLYGHDSIAGLQALIADDVTPPPMARERERGSSEREKCALRHSGAYRSQ